MEGSFECADSSKSVRVFPAQIFLAVEEIVGGVPGVTIVIVFITPIAVTYVVHMSLVLVARLLVPDACRSIGTRDWVDDDD